MTTIKDVAERANVSVATVSRAINKRGYVSDATYARIMDAIRELNYAPNQLARNLFSSSSRTIGYVLPTMNHPFFSEITQALECLFNDHGYHMLICSTVGSHDRESNIIDMLRQYRVDGIIVGSHALNEYAYTETGIPIIAFDTNLKSADVSISSNHELGGQLAADRVLKTRCKSVLQIIGNPDAQTNARIRHQVFFDRMTSAGIPCISIPIPSPMDLDITKHFSLVDDLFTQYPGIDTVFATDLFSMAVAKTALMQGKSVPQDIQVIGYDGSYLSSFSYPQITAIRQPIDKLAACIVASMCDLIAGKSVQPNIVLDDLVLIEGQTMRPIL